MKIKTEICNACEEEILIRCNSRTELIKRIESVLQALIKNEKEMILHSSGAEHYVPISQILFFESNGGKIYAHTAGQVCTTEYKLFELENILPKTFARVSKSAIVNIMLISSLQREYVGNGKLTFKNTDKSIYFSRAYYKILKTKIDEMRLVK